MVLLNVEGVPLAHTKGQSNAALTRTTVTSLKHRIGGTLSKKGTEPSVWAALNTGTRPKQNIYGLWLRQSMDLSAQALLSPLDHALNRATSQVSVQGSDLSWENPHSLEPGPLRLWPLTHRSHLDPHFNPSERTRTSVKLYAFCLSANLNRWTTKKMTFLPKAPPQPPRLEPVLYDA